jgi:hypothetical protein
MTAIGGLFEVSTVTKDCHSEAGFWPKNLNVGIMHPRLIKLNNPLRSFVARNAPQDDNLLTSGEA